MTGALRVAVGAGVAASVVAATLALARRRRRLRNGSDDAVVLSCCGIRPRSTVRQLADDTDLSRRRTSAALVRLIDRGRVRSLGGHAGIEHTVFVVVEGGS